MDENNGMMSSEERRHRRKSLTACSLEFSTDRREAELNLYDSETLLVNFAPFAVRIPMRIFANSIDGLETPGD